MPTQNQLSRRVARQYLDSLKRAGVTHLPPLGVVAEELELATAEPVQSAPALPVEPEPEAIPGFVEQSRDDEVAQPGSAPPPHSIPAPVAKSLFLNDEPAPKDHAALPRKSTIARSCAERVSELKSLSEQVARCTRCQALASTRTQTVFGVGNPEARVMFLGEAPGADEDRQGEPFVGRAGKLLNDIITACRWKREEIYICNILRCRPPENRNPTPEEAGNCREWLDGQIAIVDPEYIVCWGSVAAQNLLDSKLSMGKMRGQFYKHGRAKVLCTYHPAYLLRNPPAKKDVWQDMKFLLRDMGVDLDAK